ncbi:MAG: hypothetical protein EAY75_15665 [Bacteroidetes bacterium]|nr:MAG: hypothetical protein EAY75_15665 [Bacteroidota bacterium]
MSMENMDDKPFWREAIKFPAKLCTVAVLLVLSCHQSQDSNQAVALNTSYQQQRLANYEATILPQAHAMVQSGDLITRLGSDITSEMLRQLNQADKSYSHCGIASIENDTVFVYHSIGGEFNPNQKMKREALSSFGHPTENKAIAIFRPQLSHSQRTVLLKMVKGLYHAGVPFDMKFDYTTNHELYCAEMVAKCMAVAVQNQHWFTITQQGAFKYVSVDNLFLSPVMQLQGGWQY